MYFGRSAWNVLSFFFKFNIRSGVYIQTYQRPVRLRLLWFAGSSDPVEMVETHPKRPPHSPPLTPYLISLWKGVQIPNGEPSRSFPEADLLLPSVCLLHSLFRRVPCRVYSPALAFGVSGVSAVSASRAAVRGGPPDARPIPQSPRAPSSESGPWPIPPPLLDSLLHVIVFGRCQISA